MAPIPKDKELYKLIAKDIKAKYKHSAYRSGMIVKKYKEVYKKIYDSEEAYEGIKPTTTGLPRWFLEEWRNERGEVGYKYKDDIYRPTKRITEATPLTFEELTPKELQRAKKRKSKEKRIERFRRK
jgi:hypothetical protein